MIQLFEVGGCVRDDLLGLPSKDVDFVVIAESFSAMQDYIQKELGLKVYLAAEQYVTIRAGVPKGHWLRARCKDADFVLARKDGPSTDGRRPDFVEPGTLHDDLSRRDFTVNAIARCPKSGDLVDPFNGARDLEHGLLRFVGDPLQRIREDGLRVLRAIRFKITKDLYWSPKTHWAIRSKLSAEMLASVSVERIREELEKMFRHDTLTSVQVLADLPQNIQDAIFREGLRLSATLKS